MKKKLKPLDWIFMSGVWLQPISLMGAFWIYRHFHPYDLVKSYPWFYMVVISIMPSLYVYSGNIVSAAAGKLEYGPEDSLANRPEAFSSSDKMRAMYPAIDARLLYKRPEGIILGKELGKHHNLKYVCKKMGDAAGAPHVLCLGGSGAGKSSGNCIPSLLANPNAKFLVLDIKGELSYKSRKRDDPTVVIVDPLDRTTWGWDPLYELHSTEPSDQKIMECMDGIATYLIPIRPDDRDPFWKISARQLLSGLLIGLYKGGIHEFISLVDTILSTPPKDCINTILNRGNEDTIEAKILTKFVDLAEETMSGIVAESHLHLKIFLDSDIRYALQINPRKANPDMVLRGEKRSLFWIIPQHKLTDYYDVLQLFLNQTMAAIERLPQAKKGDEPCVFLIDELPRVVSNGPLYKLLDTIKLSRDRNLTYFLVSQSLEALESAYSKAQISDLVSNCGYLIALDVRSVETAKTICSMAGSYKEAQKSWAEKGKITVTYQDKQVLEPADLSKLILQEEAVLITPFGYCRVGKTPAFKDPYFKQKYEKITTYNDELERFKQNKITSESDYSES